MRFSRETICLTDIDAENDSFQITTKPITDDLIHSIEKVGLINPPMLVKKADHLVVVAGFRRIAACKSLDVSEMEACILEMDDLACATVAISDNAMQRPLNWVEISRAVNLLFKLCPKKAERASLLGLPGLPDNLSMAEKVAPVAGFVRTIQAGLITGQIPLPMALTLGKHDPETGALLADIFQNLGLGLNVQRETLLLAEEIAARESLTVLTVLQSKRVQDILVDPNLDRTQKRQFFREYLKTRRFPVISRAQKNFDSQLALLKLPGRIRLTPPKNFEGSRYSLQIEFETIDQLKAHLDLLTDRTGTPGFKTLLDGFNPDMDATDRTL